MGSSTSWMQPCAIDLPQPRPPGGPMTDQIGNLYDCDNCAYRYDPKKFNGLDIDDQPDDFECPSCQAGKDHFHLFKPPTNDIASASDEGATETTKRDPLGPRVMYTKATSPTLHSLQ